MKIVHVVCGLIISAFVSASHASVMHLVDGDGNLTGASNVLVDGTLYDVEFKDGSCFELFDGCDDVSGFAFDTFSAASLASHALFGQVFVDGIYGSFDSNPVLTEGCDFYIYCIVSTYYELMDATNEVNTVEAYNSIDADDIWGGRWDYQFIGNETFSVAVWSLSAIDNPSEVSAPGTAMVLVMGLVGLMVCRTRTICRRS